MGNTKQRDRGRVLTDSGWTKIWTAIRYELPEKQPLAAIARHTDPTLNDQATAYLTAETIGKIVKHHTPVDEDSIQKLFTAFGLALKPDDHISAHQAKERPNDPNFVGRQEAIAHLHELVHRGAKAIVIQARGGIGKTTLARKFLAQEFDTVIEFPIAKETKDIASIESLLEEKLRQLGEEPGREFMVSCDRLKRKLQGDTGNAQANQRIGILIDNLEPALDSAGRFIEPHRRYVEVLRILADPSVQSTTLITTRERLRESSITVQTYLLKSLDVGAWKEFFKSCSLATDTPALAALHKAYGGNAKAMEIISGAIAQDFDGDVDGYWQENQDDLFIERDLEDLVKQQFERLQVQHPDAYNLLCRMGCYRYQDVPTVLIEGLYCLMWDVPEKEHKRVVKVLRDRSLIEFDKTTYYLHPVTRSISLSRLTDNLLQKANQASAQFWTRKIQQINSIKDALEAFEAYHHYVAIGDWEEAGNIMTYYRSNAWKEKFTLGSSLVILGLIKHSTMAVNKVIEEVRDLNDLKNRGALYAILGNTNFSSGNLHSAIRYIDHLGNTLNKNNRKKESPSRFDFLFCKGLYEVYLLEYELATTLFSEAYELAKDLKYEYGINHSLCYLSFLFSFYDLQHEAILTIDNTLEAIKNIGFQNGFMFHGQFLILAYKNLGKKEKAIDMFNQIMSFIEISGYMQAKAKILTHIAELNRILKRYDEAIANHDEAIALIRRVGCYSELPEAYLQRALSYKEIKLDQKAKNDLESAFALFNDMGAPKQSERVNRYRLEVFN